MARQGKQPDGDKQPERERRAPPLLDPRVMHALSKAYRIQILSILVERQASPKEIEREIDIALGTVSYHTEVLRKADLIELREKIPRRGAVEHFYRAKWRTLLPPQLWEGLPEPLGKAISVQILEEYCDDVRASLHSGDFESDGRELCFTPMILDETGVLELGKRVRVFLDSLLEMSRTGFHGDLEARIPPGGREPIKPCQEKGRS